MQEDNKRIARPGLKITHTHTHSHLSKHYLCYKGCNHPTDSAEWSTEAHSYRAHCCRVNLQEHTITVKYLTRFIIHITLTLLMQIKQMDRANDPRLVVDMKEPHLCSININHIKIHGDQWTQQEEQHCETKPAGMKRDHCHSQTVTLCTPGFCDTIILSWYYTATISGDVYRWLYFITRPKECLFSPQKTQSTCDSGMICTGLLNFFYFIWF